ncbi:F-box domain [Dillenia turbinata]|uniref:F-box domain n=1 Tax=Dillenia turbinata TaxID=194707 RepID=A0AAN8UYQ0_9MAGN
MDRARRPIKAAGSVNSKIHRDLREIIMENTLYFLPAKSVFRFSSVCRDWKLWIHTPFFKHNQSNSFSSISGFFCQQPGEPPSFLSLEHMAFGLPDPSLSFLPEEVDLRSSSNGLICCQGRSKDKSYYICNPVNKQFKKLSKPNADHGNEPAVVLIFEPSRLNFVAEFELVCAFQSTDFDNAYEFEIYNSANGSWKVSGEICFGNRRLEPRSGVHVKGTVYWKVHHGGVLAFDLNKDRSQLIPYGTRGSLGKMYGKVCTADATSNCIRVSILSNMYTNTMEMSSHVKTWEEKLHIPLSSSSLGGVPLDPHPSIRFAGENVAVIQNHSSLFSYDRKTQNFKLLAKSEYASWFIPYVNSLVEL